MIGRTNIPCGVSGAVDGVTITDLPTCLKSLSAAATSGSVTLTLAYSSTTYVSGVDVVYKTGSYPTSPTDGTVVNASGAAESVTVSGLTNGTKYFFRVYLFRTISGVKYFQTDDTNAKVFATPSAITISGITPAIVAENYLLIDQSGSFAISAKNYPLSLTAYVVGGGMDGQDGEDGYREKNDDGEYEYYSGDPGTGGLGANKEAYSISLTEKTDCTLAVGSSVAYTTASKLSSTTFKFGNTTYSPTSNYSAAGKTGLSTLYGYVGSGGGTGGRHSSYYDNDSRKGLSGGTGAGDGGYGAHGSNRNNYTVASAGCDATTYGSAGGGGGAGGDFDKIYTAGAGGKGKQGCIIIAWE